MIAVAVESTTLATVAYDAAALVLWLEFRNHAAYCYFGVPAAVHQALMGADSKGAYFNRHVRNRFPYRRIVTDLPSAPSSITG